MSWAEDVPPEGWNRTRHVIIIMTDGETSLLPSHPLISCTSVWSSRPLSRDLRLPQACTTWAETLSPSSRRSETCWTSAGIAKIPGKIIWVSDPPGTQHSQPRAGPPSFLSPLDVYVFGVGPLVDPTNINALASKKNNEQHVFRVKDMEDLEDVFYKMIGRKTQGNTGASCLQAKVADVPLHPRVYSDFLTFFTS